MNKLLKMTKWAFTVSAVVALVFIYSCGSDDPEPVNAPSISYAATTVPVGTSQDIPAASNGDAATSFAFKSPTDVPNFVSISATTGVITVAPESTTGIYDVDITASNDGGSTEAKASITISVNADGFDPRGKHLLWKYFMNKSPNVEFSNLDAFPGGDAFPNPLPITDEWPGGTDFVINPMTENIEGYFAFSVIQGFLLQVPGDDACNAEEGVNGDTLLVIVNDDLSLSTICPAGSVVDLGPSLISFDGTDYMWTLNLSLQGNPIPYSITGVKMAEFTEYDFATGTPRAFSSYQGTVPAFTTPTDFENYLGSLAFLEVDVVFEILN